MVVKQINVRIEEKRLNQFDDICKREERSRQQMIRYVILKYMRNYGRK